MTGHQQPRTAAHMTPGMVLTHGTAREEWCTACKAYTRLAGPVLLLATSGVAVVGAWSRCEICDDLADPLPARRIRHG